MPPIPGIAEIDPALAVFWAILSLGAIHCLWSLWWRPEYSRSFVTTAIATLLIGSAVYAVALALLARVLEGL